VLVNSLYGNGESCRGVALECGVTPMLISVLQQTDNEECLAMAARYTTQYINYLYTFITCKHYNYAFVQVSVIACEVFTGN
jgi:hypothetical protein